MDDDIIKNTKYLKGKNKFTHKKPWVKISL